MGKMQRGILLGMHAAAIACCFSFGAAAHAATAPANSAPASPAPAMTKPAKPQPVVIPDKTKDDPEKVAAARAFVLAYHPKLDPAEVQAKLNRVMPRMIARAKDDDPKLDVKKYERDQRAEITARQDGLLEMQAHIASRHFTLQELKDLHAFFAGPLGAKLVTETPVISKEMMQQLRLFVPPRASDPKPPVPVKKK